MQMWSLKLSMIRIHTWKEKRIRALEMKCDYSQKCYKIIFITNVLFIMCAGIAVSEQFLQTTFQICNVHFSHVAKCQWSNSEGYW